MDQHLPQFQQHRSSDLHPHYPPHPPTHQLLQYQNQLQFTSHPHQPVNHQPLHSTHAQQLRSQQQQQHLQSLLQTVTSSVSDDADRPAMANNLNARSAPGVGGFPVPDYPIGVPPSVEPASVDPSWHAVLTDGGHPQQGRAPGPARRPFVSHADQRQQWSIATPQQTPTATVTSPPRRSLFPPSFYAENPPPFLQGPKPASLPNSGSHVVSTHGYPSSSTSSSWRENETVPYTQDRSSRSSPLPPQRRSGSFRSGRSSADPSLTAVSVPSPSSPATSQHLLHPFASPAQLGSAKIRSERSPSQQSFATSQHNWHRETPPLSVSHSAPASPALRAQPEQHSVPPPKILLSKGVHILHPLVIQKLLSSIEELSMGVMESLSLLKHSLLPSDNGIRSATPTDRLFAVPSDHQIEISHASDLAALSMSNAVSFLLAASFILHSAGTQQQVGHLKTYFESVKLDIAAAAKTGALQGSTFIREQLANRVGQADQLSIQLWAFVVIELENSLELSSAVLDSAALPTDTEAIRSMARTLCQFILSKSKLPKDASLDSFLSVTSDILFYCDKFFKGYDRLGHIIPRVLELDAGSASGADLFEFAGSEAVARALDLSIVISNETKVAGKKKPEQLSSQSRDQAVRQWTDTLLTLSYIVEDTAATISLMEEQDRKIGTRQSSLRSSSPSLSGSLTSATPSTSSQSADDGLGAETFAFAVRSPSPVDPAGKSQRPRIMWQGANSRHIHSADPSRAGRFTLERPPRDSSSDRHRDGASSPGLPPLRRRGSVDSVLKERADLSSAGTGSSHHSGPLSLVDSIVPPDLLAAWKRALRLMSSRARGTSLSPQLAASVKTDSSVQPLSFKYRPALRVRTRNFAKALNATFLAFVSDVSSGKLGTAGGSDYNFTLSVSTFGSLDLPPSVSPDPAGTSSVLERLMIVGSALLETVESLVADGCDIIKESEKSERSLSGGGKSKSEDLRSQLEAATGAVVAALAALWERRPSTRPLDSLGSGQHSRFPAAEVLQDQISRNVRRLPANIQLMVLLCFQSLTSVESLHFALDDFLASVDLALLEIERRSAASPASTSPAAVEGHDGHAVSAGVGVLGELGFAAEKGALAASEVSPASEKPPTSQTPTETTATAEAMSSHFPAKIPDYLLPYILEDNYVGLVFEGLKKDAPLQKRVSMDPAASDGRFVRSGTMAMLVVRMTHYCTRDPSFTHSFLQSFSSFTTLNILLTHIIMRLESTLSLPEDLPPNFVHSYIAYVRIPVRIAALRLIAMLLELYMPPSHRSDMAGYRDKIDEALRYKDVHVTLFNGGDADDELKKGAERLKDVAAHIEKLWGRLTAPLPPPRVSTRPQSAPHPVAAMGSKPVSNLPPLDTRHTTVAVNLPKDLILIDPVSVAQHLVAIDREIYVTITPQGLLAAAKSSGRWRASEEEAALDAPAGSPPVSGVIALNERFNVVVGLVTTAVIGCDTPSARAEMMVHWIRVANCCLEYLNLNAANAITASLSSASLFRLTKSWEKVPKSAKSLLQSLQHLFSPSANFRVLRSLLANIASTKRSRSKSPLQQYCVPWLGMHLREIIQLSEIHPVIGIPAGVDGQKPQSDLQTQQQLEPMINFDRCWWISTVIDQALQFQWPAGCVHLDRVPNSWSHWGVVLDALPTGSPSKVEVHDGGGSDASAPDVSDPSALDGLLSPPRFPWAQIPTVHKVLRDGGSDLLRTPSQQFQASLALEPRVASGPNGPNGVGVGGGGTGLVSPAGAGDAFQQGQGGAGSGGGSRFRTSSGGAPGGGGLLLSGIVSGGAQVRSLMSAVSPSSASGAGGPGPLTLLPPVPSAGILGGNGRKPERGWLQLKRS